MTACVERAYIVTVAQGTDRCHQAVEYGPLVLAPFDVEVQTSGISWTSHRDVAGRLVLEKLAVAM